MVPARPKIYHILHVDRLPSIIANGYIWCDAVIAQQSASLGTTIGMNAIKRRRLNELTLASYPGLHVGDCVPFYFCPRSIMLYVIYQANHPELDYRGGQEPIIHLEADLYTAVAWANSPVIRKRWAFTLSNAGSYFFEDRCDLACLSEIDWSAVNATNWQSCQEGKQAEFLIEYQFPWQLVERIGVHSSTIRNRVATVLQSSNHQPPTDIKREWYY